MDKYITLFKPLEVKHTHKKGVEYDVDNDFISPSHWKIRSLSFEKLRDFTPTNYYAISLFQYTDIHQAVIDIEKIGISQNRFPILGLLNDNVLKEIGESSDCQTISLRRKRGDFDAIRMESLIDYCVLEIDGYELSREYDFNTESIDAIEEVLRVLDISVDATYQLSSSQRPISNKLCVHIFMNIDGLYSLEHIKAYILSLCISIDTSIYNGTNPCYIAPPEFKTSLDSVEVLPDVIKCRIGHIKGMCEVLTMPSVAELGKNIKKKGYAYTERNGSIKAISYQDISYAIRDIKDNVNYHPAMLYCANSYFLRGYIDKDEGVFATLDNSGKVNVRDKIILLMNEATEDSRKDTWYDRMEDSHLDGIVESAFEFVKCIKDKERTENTNKASKYGSTMNLRDLMNTHFEPIEFIIDSILPPGRTLFVGKPKKGKSFLALIISIHIAAGRSIFGHKVKRGRVLYLGLEDNFRRLKNRTEIVCSKLGFDIDDILDNIDFRIESARQGDGFEKEILDWLKVNPDARMIVVDVLEKVRAPGGGNDVYKKDYAVGDGLKSIHDIYPDFASLVVHHSRKAASDDPYDLISGTLGLSGGFDNIFSLVDDCGTRTLHLTGRDIEETDEIVLQMTDSGFYTCEYFDPILNKANTSETRKAVFESIPVLPETITTKEIISVTGLSDKDVSQQLTKLLKDMLIVKVSRGVYSRRISNGGG